MALRLALVGLAMLVAAPSQAVVLYQVERFSNGDGRITGSGTFDLATTDLIALGGSTTEGPSSVQRFDGSMSAGAARVIFTATQSESFNFILGFNQGIEPGARPSGAIRTRFSDVAWEFIRTTGDVFDQRSGATLGRYEIVAPVPLPATGLFLAAGFAGLAFVRRILRAS